jgi:plexin A
VTSSTLRKSIVTLDGRVIVSDDNTVYLLKGDLTNVTRRVRKEGQSPEGMTLTSDESRLIVCWANSLDSGGQLVNTAPCTVYNSSTLEDLVNATLPATTGVGAPKGNSYSVSRGSSDVGEETFFVMSSSFSGGNDNELYHREYRVFNGSVTRQETPTAESITSRRYITGITVGNYSYVLAFDVESVGRVRVIRLCHGRTSWDNWYEIQLNCGTVRKIPDFRSTLLDANFLTVEDGVSEAMLVITVESEEGSSDTCSFPLSSIDSKATSLLQYCQSNTRTLPFPWMTAGACDSSVFTECDLSRSPIPGIVNGPGRLSTQADTTEDPQIQPVREETPLNSLSSTVLSSTEVFLVDGVVVMFAGLSTGEVRKYTADNFTANEVDPTPERTWSLSSSVKSLTYSRGSDYVYAVTGTAVYRLPVEECSNFTDCSSCTTSGGRLCGWCSVENKCSRRSQCSNSTSSLRWVQDSGTCLSVSIASAESISGDVKSYPREQETINVTITNLPPDLSGESFQCVFGPLGSGELTPLNGNMYSCRVPNITSFTGEDTRTVSFTLRSTLLNIDFGLVVDGVTFYDCSVRDNCSSCVGSLNCNWCPVEFGCRTRGGDCSASPVNKSQSCPQVLPSSTTDGRYYLHEGLSSPDVSLVLNAQNLISPTGGYSYVCELSEMGRTFSAVVTSSTVTCNVSAVSISQAERESPVRLVWRNGPMNFTIESSTGADQRVVLYSCPRLAVDCSTCIGLNDNFNCAYCTSTDSGSCMLSTLTCSPGPLIRPLNSTCPTPMITETSPSAGPVEGGTLYTIRGSNLGAHPRENVTILFGERLCPIKSSQSGSLVCVVPSTTLEGEVDVTLSRKGVDRHPVGRYRYAVPRVDNVMPSKSPTRGGSTVYVMGVNLDIGNVERTSVAVVFGSSRKRQTSNSTMLQLPVESVNSTHITCRTVDASSSSVTSGQRGEVNVTIDGSVFSNENVQLEYVQPMFGGLFDTEDVNQEETLLQGGEVPLIVVGTNLDAAVSPVLTLSAPGLQPLNVTCTVVSPTQLSCVIPQLSNVNTRRSFQYSLIFDNEVLSNLSSVQPLTAVADPVFSGSEPTQYQDNGGQPLTISGSNLDNVRSTDYNITVGGIRCEILSIDNSRIFCRPPQSRPPGPHPAPIIVVVGTRAGVQVGTLEYTLNLIIIIVPVAVGGSLIISLIIMFVIICCVYGCYKRKSKERDRKFQGLITQMELMESELAEECRRAFTELQTDLELAYDKSDQHLPFLEFRSFAMRVLFPQEKDHPVLQPLAVPSGLDQDTVMRQLDFFRQLIMDKKFLLIFIRTLEMQQGKFTVKDKCNVASLLMVAFQNDLDYANEILMALLHELIQRSVAKYHPKLLLRRTDSVAEKMLTNWLCFLLYLHVVEHIGEPLYVLFRAIKSQLEKGPIDVVTGEARQSLSEEKLLRTATDPQPVEGVVVTESGEVPIKMWDCDSISQAKEKVLDAIYKNAPVSSRPAISDVDLEFLQTSDKGLVLRDHDSTNRVEGTWKKINTLGHYNLTEVVRSCVFFLPTTAHTRLVLHTMTTPHCTLLVINMDYTGVVAT